MFSHFFIDRPEFAFVILILITIALSVLPVSEFPEISPPQVSARAFYPGANVDVVESTVAVPIETETNGVNDMT
ncbi:MAG: efflux RND transporter permease subunit [Rhodospirillales bacterium]|nr:efflux RND transporter permease subunit [Rhodospirillales bacterium]